MRLSIKPARPMKREDDEPAGFVSRFARRHLIISGIGKATFSLSEDLGEKPAAATSHGMREARREK